MNRADARRQAKEDEKLLKRGLVPAQSSPDSAAAMTRALYALIETAKRTRNIDDFVAFIGSKIDATLVGLQNIPVACGKGCSHCCHSWVSVSAPEALRVAKIVRQRGEEAIAKVRAAYEATKDYDFNTRDRHPYPCALLRDDACSIYESRPRVCRLTVSGDLARCIRVYRHASLEGIPAPGLYLQSRSEYGIALTLALKRAQLPHRAYEYNSALVRALERPDSESAWLGGDDVFAGVSLDPADLLSTVSAQKLQRYAFPD